MRQSNARADKIPSVYFDTTGMIQECWQQSISAEMNIIIYRQLNTSWQLILYHWIIYGWMGHAGCEAPILL